MIMKDKHSKYKISVMSSNGNYEEEYYCNHWEHVVCEDYYSLKYGLGYKVTTFIIFQDRVGNWYTFETCDVNYIMEWQDGEYK